MSLIGFNTTNYKEQRKPAEDASSVGRWIIGPAVLSAFLGAAMFGGLAGMSQFIGGWFVFWSLMFGGGFMGLLMMLLRVLTYDKKPYVNITETTQIPIRETPKHEPLRGNAAPTHIQPNLSVIVETENNGRYTFSRRQMMLMMNRIDNENFQVAQNGFEIAPGQDYKTVCAIMSRLGYWKVWKKSGKINKVEWLDDGIKWLHANAR